LARTVSGGGIAAIRDEKGTATLAKELEQVQAAFGSELRLLHYRDKDADSAGLFDVSPYRAMEAGR
jgi:thiamine monophosphate synthase